MEEDEQDQEVPEAPSPVEEEEGADNEQEVGRVAICYSHLCILLEHSSRCT